MTADLAGFAVSSDPALDYIPFIRKDEAMADDPQKDEDEHIKQVKEKTGAK